VDDIWAKVLVGVVVAVVVGVLAWLWRPMLARLDTSGRRVRAAHGLKVTLIRDPAVLAGLPSAVSLGLQPEWLDDVTFYFRQGRPTVDPPGPDLRLWSTWGRGQGGEDVYFTHALVAIQATQDRNVLLQAPTVRRTRVAVREGAICGPSGLGGNGLLVRRFYVDLDPVVPDVKFIDDGTEVMSALFTMKKGDTEAFLLVAGASRDRHEWTIAIPCIIDGVSVVLSVDDNALVTIGPEGVPRFSWVEGMGWVDS